MCGVSHDLFGIPPLLCAVCGFSAPPEPPQHRLLALSDAGTVSIVSDGFLTPLRVTFRQRFVSASLNPVNGVTMALAALEGGGLQLYRVNITSGTTAAASYTVIPAATYVQCKCSRCP